VDWPRFYPVLGGVAGANRAGSCCCCCCCCWVPLTAATATTSVSPPSQPRLWTGRALLRLYGRCAGPDGGQYSAPTTGAQVAGYQAAAATAVNDLPNLAHRYLSISDSESQCSGCHGTCRTQTQAGSAVAKPIRLVASHSVVSMTGSSRGRLLAGGTSSPRTGILFQRCCCCYRSRRGGRDALLRTSSLVHGMVACVSGQAVVGWLGGTHWPASDTWVMVECVACTQFHNPTATLGIPGGFLVERRALPERWNWNLPACRGGVTNPAVPKARRDDDRRPSSPTVWIRWNGCHIGPRWSLELPAARVQPSSRSSCPL